jgi:hypothetical protein
MMKDNPLYVKLSNSSFYPGGIWVKRITRLMVIMAIGFNLFLNDFQDHILTIIEEQSCEIALIAERIELEQLRLNRIENGSWKEWSVDWLAYFMNSPKSNEINRFIDISQKTLDGYKEVTSRLVSIDSGTALAMKVLRWTSFFMWFPIGLSALWLIIDIDKGNAPVFVMVGLLISVPINIISYNLLMNHAELILGLLN